MSEAANTARSAPAVEGLAARSITEYGAREISQSGVRGVGGTHGVNAHVRAFGALLVIEAWGTASEIERRPLRPGFPTMDIIFVEQGEFEYLDGTAWRVSRGPLMIAPSGLPHRVRFTTDWRFIVARVPRDALLPFVPLLSDQVSIATELRMTERAMQALLTDLVRNPDPATEADSHTIDRQVLDMAGTLVLARQRPDERSGSPRNSLRTRALSAIAARSGDTRLTPNELAEELSISLRRLQGVFAEAGSSVAGEIRRERARVARSLLQDARFDELGTTELAERAGFGSSSSMRRALEDLYGLGPRDLRSGRTAA
ncbi:helix-turn-helix domain-containing protein [Leucobacter chromiireducens]|uniref:helix-turn-helix domain-containing protein n=1 Tax=Leucobacter chromiireducens TaxID=283877 RepID=UPI000F632116|nr:helix-turn-helix domain-containing protein [Leucobacter chromiireducens]